MKNSLISYFIFFILVAFLIYADINFKNLCTDIIDMCNQMESTIDSYTKEENFKNSMEIFNLIQDKGDIAAIYINHMDYDVMLNEALKLTVYIEKDDKSETEASLHLLKFSTKHMKELQVPNIENIF